MKIAFVIFNKVTWLDLVGVYDPITRLKSMHYIPDLTWDLCACTDTVADNFGFEVKPTQIQNSLAEYDALIVPGGHGTRELQFDERFLKWIRTSGETSTKISICTGSLILGAAGFLTGKRATTNYQEYETLRPYCKEVLTDRIVEDGNVITAGAVSASLDLGLYLCNKWAGRSASSEIRKKMDYRG